MGQALVQEVYVKTFGRFIRVTAIFTDADAANHYMASCNDGVIAEVEGLVYLAAMTDLGIRSLPTGGQVVVTV